MRNDLIKFAPPFAGLAERELALVAESFVVGHCPANAALFKAGDQSEALYLIEKGFVRLTTESGHNLATLGPGSVIGDSTLFQGATQDVNAICVADLDVWKLPDRKLRELVLQHPAIGIQLSKNFGSLLAQMEDYLVQRLARTTELSGLPRNTLQAVANQLQPRALAAQETLYRAGEATAGLFVIERGSVELRPEANAAEPEGQRLQGGALVGALALLTNKPYSNTAIALEDSLLWVLPTENFQAINSRHPGLRRSLGRNVRARLNRADQAQAATRLAQMPLFGEVPPESMAALVQRMVLQHVPAGERVYRVGEAGDAIYLIESGEIELTEENSHGVVEEKARIGAAGFFGEMSLFTGVNRSEDATATRNTNLWILYKSDLDDLAVHHPAIGKALSQGLATRLSTTQHDRGEEHFRNFQLLADLNPADLKQVVQHLRPTRFRTGEQIYRASSPADALYLLEKGQVRIQPLSGGSWMVEAGEAFGERSLLTNQPRNSTAFAESDADVWMLSKKDFDLLVTRYPSLAINISRILSQRLSEGPSNALAPYEPPVGPAVAMPRRRQGAAAYSANRNQERAGFGEWFANLSGGAKVRLALLILLLLFIIGVVVPYTVLTLLGETSVANGASLSLTSRALAAVYSSGSYEVAAADKDLAQAIAAADSAAPPTPTYTPLPTNTPVGSSGTPVPTGVFNPEEALMPTLAAEDSQQPVLQTQSLAINEEPAPQPPVVEVAAAAAPPPVARAWDPRLDQLGVTLEAADVASGQPYWRLVEARWADEIEATGTHHIYVEVLDENGSRIVGHPVTVWWGEGKTTGDTEDKAPPDYAFNFQMYAAGYAYKVKVEASPSHILHGAGMGSIDKRTYGIHVSYYLTYQKTIKP
ncbi:MAG: cyclic nucleotide-binding domain-containing protein [Chloroflexota bacterium]|nr:cyclic nucleotide-binding domain-containing protein [Chloroflexota bacterium]